MLNRLTRILLALVTAFVFTGQMEAAAQHCARLAEQAAAAIDDAPPCHATQEAAASHHGMDLDAAPDTAAGHHGGKSAPDAPDTCACIAALKICMEFVGSAASTRVEPYAWLTSPDADVHSSQPDPDLRPPRA